MSNKTVYIIGAGASKEAGLPIGTDLKIDISNLLDIRFDKWGREQVSGDFLIRNALHVYVESKGERDINPYLYKAWHIRDAIPQAISIDNFIDTHRDDDIISLCGKLAIVRAILSAEEKSRLYFDNSQRNATMDFNSLKNTWYLPFFQLLTENCNSDGLKERLRDVVLIIFNYDRCIEHFIYHALRNYYRLPDDQVADLVRDMNIYHPYGSVGSLPWLNNNDSMTFGGSHNANQLITLSRQIKTFAEGTAPNSSNIASIKEHMWNAGKLVFIGFAFHKLNMQLIAPKKKSVLPRLKCYATAFNISKSDQEVIRKQIKDLYNNTVVDTEMTNIECYNFFSEFWRSLAY